MFGCRDPRLKGSEHGRVVCREERFHMQVQARENLTADNAIRFGLNGHIRAFTQPKPEQAPVIYRPHNVLFDAVAAVHRWLLVQVIRRAAGRDFDDQFWPPSR